MTRELSISLVPARVPVGGKLSLLCPRDRRVLSGRRFVSRIKMSDFCVLFAVFVMFLAVVFCVFCECVCVCVLCFLFVCLFFNPFGLEGEDWEWGGGGGGGASGFAPPSNNQKPSAYRGPYFHDLKLIRELINKVRLKNKWKCYSLAEFHF